MRTPTTVTVQCSVVGICALHPGPLFSSFAGLVTSNLPASLRFSFESSSRLVGFSTQGRHVEKSEHIRSREALQACPERGGRWSDGGWKRRRGLSAEQTGDLPLIILMTMVFRQKFYDLDGDSNARSRTPGGARRGDCGEHHVEELHVSLPPRTLHLRIQRQLRRGQQRKWAQLVEPPVSSSTFVVCMPSTSSLLLSWSSSFAGGKSAILTALIVALGGNAQATNRGSSLKGFVKEGER